jgi:uncharacterized iron-regulated membrane protein
MQASVATTGSRDSKWTLVHRYLGLLFGVWIIAVGVTGSFLSYYRQIDAFLHPELFTAVNSPRHPDLDAMVSTVQNAYPDRFILYLERYFLSPDETYPFVLSEPLPRTADGLDLAALQSDGTDPSLEVFVDPRTHEIVGARPFWTWIKLVRGFHRDLLLHREGANYLGALAIVLFLACVAGGVIWWRLSRRRLKRALSFRLSSPTPQLLRDTHTVFGAYALIVIGWLALTGALMCYEMPLRHLANDLAGRERRAPVTVPDASDFVSLNEARDVALAEYPDSDVVLVRMAKTAADRLTFRLYPDDAPVSIYTRQVYVHAGSASVVGRFDPGNQPWTDSLFGVWLIWFHNGGMLGTVGHLLNIAAGIVLTALVPTGVYIWWRKRALRLRRRSPAQHSAGAPVAAKIPGTAD